MREAEKDCGENMEPGIRRPQLGSSVVTRLAVWYSMGFSPFLEAWMFPVWSDWWRGTVQALGASGARWSRISSTLTAPVHFPTARGPQSRTWNSLNERSFFFFHIMWSHFMWLFVKNRIFIFKKITNHPQTHLGKWTIVSYWHPYLRCLKISASASERSADFHLNGLQVLGFSVSCTFNKDI